MSDQQAGLPGLAGQLGTETGGQGGQGGQGGEGKTGKRGKPGRTGAKGEKGDTPESDEFFMARPLWLGLKRWTWVKIAFAFMTFMSAFALYLVERNGDEDQQARDEIVAEGEFTNCVERNELRESFRALVVIATEGGGFDLTAVPGFVDLDAETQQFFRNLAELSDSGGGTSQRDRLLATIVDENCDDLPSEPPIEGEQND